MIATDGLRYVVCSWASGCMRTQTGSSSGIKRMRHHIVGQDMHLARFDKLLNLLLEHNYIHRYNEHGAADREGKFCHVRTWRWQTKSVGKYEATEVAVDCPCEDRKTQGERSAPASGESATASQRMSRYPRTSTPTATARRIARSAMAKAQLSKARKSPTARTRSITMRRSTKPGLKSNAWPGMRCTAKSASARSENVKA